MYPVSEKFTRYITGDHERTTRVASLMHPDAVPVDISDWFEGGSIITAPQDIRRSGTLTFRRDDLGDSELSPDDPLAPYGQELFVEHGLVYPDGTEELVPQGVLRITAVARRPPFVTCTVHDRAWTVAGAKLETTLTIASGQPMTTAIRTLLETAYPQIRLRISDTGHLTPTITLDAFADPWIEGRKMATSIGYDLYFDRIGECPLEPEVDNADAIPVVNYSDASDLFIPRDDSGWFNLATYDMEQDLDTEDVFNAVVATGESTGNATPFRAVAYDLAATSPTRWGGRFGRRVMEWRSELITSQAQAEVAAQTQLQKVAGITEGLTIPAVPHPALDVGDAIRVVRRELGIDQIHVVDSVPLPLRAGAGLQTVTTRRRRVVLSSE